MHQWIKQLSFIAQLSGIASEDSHHVHSFWLAKRLLDLDSTSDAFRDNPRVQSYAAEPETAVVYWPCSLDALHHEPSSCWKALGTSARFV